MKNKIFVDEVSQKKAFPGCRFVGQNKVCSKSTLKNCMLENCEIMAPVSFANLRIENAKISLCARKNQVSNKINQKYFSFLQFFDANVFDNIHFALVCPNFEVLEFARSLFENLHAKVDAFQCNFSEGLRVLQKTKAQLGFVIDEACTKILAVNHAGQVIDGDEILYLLAWWLHNQRKTNRIVVGTVVTNLGIENKLKALGLDLVRAKNIAKLPKDAVLAVSQEGDVCIKINGKKHGPLLAMRILATLFLENKNIWVRVKENKYVQVCKCVEGVEHKEDELKKISKTFMDFYSIKLQGNGRVLIWHKNKDVHILVESMDKTMAAIVALDIKKKIIKYFKNNKNK